jgi:hypothetical protein
LENHEAFALDLSEVEACPHTRHRLEVDPSVPLQQKPLGRPLSLPELELVTARDQVDKVIRNSFAGQKM